MTATDPGDLHSLVDRLANHRTLGAAPREKLEWLAGHGTVRRVDVGDVLSEKCAPVEGCSPSFPAAWRCVQYVVVGQP